MYNSNTGIKHVFDTSLVVRMISSDGTMKESTYTPVWYNTSDSYDVAVSEQQKLWNSLTVML